MFHDVDDFYAVVDDQGRIVLPPGLVENQVWPTGTRLLFEETHQGVLITTALDEGFEAEAVQRHFSAPVGLQLVRQPAE